MTAPLNPGIKFGFPPQILIFGGEVPTATVYTATISTQVVVPMGVTRMAFECWGSGQAIAAPGSANIASVGTSGGYAFATVAVNPGDILTLTVGALPALGNGDLSSVSVNGTVVCLARGGGASTTQVGDVTLLPAIGVGAIDTTVWTTPIKPGAPRGAGTSYVVSASLSEGGSTPGGGGYAVNGGGTGGAGIAMIVVYTPQPVNFA